MPAPSTRVNLISLLALLVLAGVVAITPEARHAFTRLADRIEGVRRERAEIRRRQEEQVRKQLAEELEASSRNAAGSPASERPEEPPQPPPHVVLGQDGKYHPDAGYSWVTDAPADYRVEWRPGTPYPGNPHVLASSEPDQWTPDSGYDWLAEKGVDDLRVAWKPGKRHLVYEHVLAAAKEGEWNPEPGYRWASEEPNDLTVVPDGSTGKP